MAGSAAWTPAGVAEDAVRVAHRRPRAPCRQAAAFAPHHVQESCALSRPAKQGLALSSMRSWAAHYMLPGWVAVARVWWQ